MKWERIKIPTAGPLDTSWTGHLTRGDTIAGELRDRFDWRLALTATADGPRKLHVTATLAQPGLELAPWEDSGERGAMLTPGYVCMWVGTLDRDGAGWVGVLVDSNDGWTMDLTGTTTEPGVIALRGVVRDRPVRFGGKV